MYIKEFPHVDIQVKTSYYVVLKTMHILQTAASTTIYILIYDIYSNYNY